MSDTPQPGMPEDHGPTGAAQPVAEQVYLPAVLKGLGNTFRHVPKRVA